MSNKFYRKPARETSNLHERVPESDKQPADAGLTPDNARIIGKIKSFLERVLDHALTTLAEAANLPKQDTPEATHETRTKRLSLLARLGIAACRTLMQALRIEGTDSKQVRQLLSQTVQHLQAPIATG
jgi:hypothetical protein